MRTISITQPFLRYCISIHPSLLLLSSSPPPLLLLSSSSLPPLSLLSSSLLMIMVQVLKHSHSFGKTFFLSLGMWGERRREGGRGREEAEEMRGVTYVISLLFFAATPTCKLSTQVPRQSAVGGTRWSATSSLWEKNLEIKMFFYYKLSHLPPSLSPSL